MKLICIFSIILFSHLALADCNYSLSVPSFSYTVSDINSPTSSDFTISLNNNNLSSCQNFFITFNKGIHAADYNRKAKRNNSNNYLFYNLSKSLNSSSILKGPNDATSLSEVLEGTILQNQTKTMTYYFTYTQPASTIPRSGTYRDNIQLQSYRGVFPDYNNNDKSKNLSITIIVPKFAALSLLETGGGFDPSQNMKVLDFGELTTNQELGFDIRLVSNAGFQLKLSSANNGYLKIPAALDTNGSISYNLLINNQLINLSNSQNTPVTIATGTGVTTAGGALSTAKVIIQNVDGKNAGIYSDYLTLTVMTTE